MTITEPDDMFHQARWWHPEGEACRCELCPRLCSITEGGTGFCYARGNIGGSLVSFSYGMVCASMVDPIEKKPMFHFHPGARLYSVGTFGCNLDCGFCQNSVLARAGRQHVPSKYTTPEELVSIASEKKVDGIGWTFNEPTVWSEYIIDVSAIARPMGMFTMLNTNGYISPKARADLLEHVDAVKVDIKGFTEETYNRLCKGSLAPVLDTCKDIAGRGIHLELAYPVVPGRTDASADVESFGRWVMESLGPDVPIHLFRFQPAYHLSAVPATEVSVLRDRQRALLGLGLKYVYLGGITGEGQDTRCPSCGAVVISRSSEESSEKVFVRKEQVSRFCPTYTNVRNLTFDGYCPFCGESIPIRKNTPTGFN
jgi:pyruvate formate lyase activating enzyme